jgi:hypothetical protein
MCRYSDSLKKKYNPTFVWQKLGWFVLSFNNKMYLSLTPLSPQEIHQKTETIFPWPFVEAVYRMTLEFIKEYERLLFSMTDNDLEFRLVVILLQRGPGKGSLGPPAWAAPPATRPRISGQKWDEMRWLYYFHGERNVMNQHIWFIGKYNTLALSEGFRADN